MHERKVTKTCASGVCVNSCWNKRNILYSWHDKYMLKPNNPQMKQAIEERGIRNEWIGLKTL